MFAEPLLQHPTTAAIPTVVLIARMHVEEMATPVVALGLDGTWYDAAALEATWRITPALSTSDWYMRVVAARCLGLLELDARLRAGPRPREARLETADMLRLPPCDVDRAAFYEVRGTAGGEPALRRRDARLLVGDGQPVPMPHGHEPSVQVSLAVLVSDELHRVTAREAARSIAGVTLLVDWGGYAACTLGPGLLVGRSLRDIASLPLEVQVGEDKHVVHPRNAPFQPAECVSFASQHVPLRPGDVVGVGGLFAEPQAIVEGTRVTATLAPLMKVAGWPTKGPEPVSWRL